MIEVAWAESRFVMSVVTGRRFNIAALRTIVDAMAATHREFGSLGPHASEFVNGAPDAKTQEEIVLGRFRAQARRAASETEYYHSLFDHVGIDPGHLNRADIAAVPIVDRETLATRADEFVAGARTPVIWTATTGSTGQPLTYPFSQYELDVAAMFSAMSLIQSGTVVPGDVVCRYPQESSAAFEIIFRATCAAVGANLVLLPSDPAHAIAEVAHERRGSLASVLAIDASTFGALVEAGFAAGYGPADFGLRQIILGGEIVTAGLRDRSRRLFGDAVVFSESYSPTEIIPITGIPCTQGHLHYNPLNGLVETVPLVEEEASGEFATVVATPFPPFRELSILLRYDTGDVVRSLVRSAPPTCEMHVLPATGVVLGKRRDAMRHRYGWTFTRDVVEALEALDVVPLPARCGFWSEDGGVVVEIVVRQATAHARDAVGDALVARGIPLRRLHLALDRDQLWRPRPLRCDMRLGARVAPMAVPHVGSIPA